MRSNNEGEQLDHENLLWDPFMISEKKRCFYIRCCGELFSIFSVKEHEETSRATRKCVFGGLIINNEQQSRGT
jgi:hypothetical protein